MNNTPTDETFTDKVIDIFHAELISINKKLREARRLAEKYRNLSCQDQDQADATLLPWETNQPTNRTMNMEHLLAATNKVVELNNQLAAVTEQLTAAREELAELKEEYGTWWAQKRIAIDELKEVTEQRDRLAEALRKVVTSWDEATWLDDNEFESFREALSAVKGGSNES